MLGSHLLARAVLGLVTAPALVGLLGVFATRGGRGPENPREAFIVAACVGFAGLPPALLLLLAARRLSLRNLVQLSAAISAFAGLAYAVGFSLLVTGMVTLDLWGLVKLLVMTVWGSALGYFNAGLFMLIAGMKGWPVVSPHPPPSS